MKIVVVGGTGLIGRKLVAELRGMGQAVIAASLSTSVDAVTGEGLAAALAGADAVIDASNPRGIQTPAAAEGAAAFFERSSATLLAAERAAGVRHHIVLSIVGADRVGTSGYFRAKAAQESAVMAGRVPFSILRSTQFFEFANTIADWNTVEDTVHLPGTRIRPVASSDVVEALVSTVRSAPTGAVAEIAGPEEMPLDDFVRRVLLTQHDQRYVMLKEGAQPVGFTLEARFLAPDDAALITRTTLDDWLSARPAPAPVEHPRHAAAFTFAVDER